MSDKIAELASKIADCQKRLDATELARQPTTRIEGELASLTREHDAAIQAKAAEAQAERQAEDDQIAREAMVEAAAIAARIASVLPPITIPTPAVDLASITAATRIHQRARLELDKVVAVLEEKQKVRDAVAGLISDHEAILAPIGDRLETGAELPGDDMARLRSVQFLERKTPVLAAAKAEVTIAEKAVKQADDTRKRAYESLTTVDENVRRDGYIARLKVHDDGLREGLGRVAAVDKRQHRRPQYIGSHELRQTLRQMEIQNPVMADTMNPSSPRNYLRRTG